MLACSSSLLFTNPMGVWELQPRNFYKSVLTGSRRARGFRRRRFFSTGDQDSLFFFKRCSRGHRFLNINNPSLLGGVDECFQVDFREITREIGKGACRERVWRSVEMSVCDVVMKQKKKI